MEKNTEKITREELMEKFSLSDEELEQAAGGANIDYGCVGECMKRKLWPYLLPACVAECIC